MGSGVGGSGSYQVAVKFTLTNGDTKSLTCKVLSPSASWYEQQCTPITLTKAFKKVQITIQYSKPQGADPVWNTANCRNRRIFKDRAVQKTAANTKPFLLQTYRRDMGGGQFVLMKDLSAPIHIKGRRWGAFRMGFRQS
jgi:hypothetical protein